MVRGMGAFATSERPAVSRSALPAVAHLIPEYLPRSATFVHTALRAQTRHRPLVLAGAISNLAEFPVGEVVDLDRRAGLPRVVDRAGSALLGYAAGYGRAAVAAARRQGCLLVHAHFGWSGRDVIHAAKAAGLPVVTTFYGRDLSESDRARTGSRFSRDPYRPLFAAGARFIVEGPAMARHLERIGCDPAKVAVVPIGIDLDLFPFSPRERGDRFVIMQAARFVEKKGFDLTIRAFARVLENVASAELWLVGDGPLRGELEALVRRLGVGAAVRFTGMVSHEDYRRLLEVADVCVQPSRVASDGDTEGGAPTTLLEVQAVGIPVVATRHADIPFVVPDARALADEEDVEGISGALVRVALEDDTDRERRLLEARAHIETSHGMGVTAAQIEAIYDEVVR